MAMAPSSPNTWILVDHNKVGTYSQCLGVAQALGVTPTFKTMQPRWPWKGLPPCLWFSPLKAQKKGHDPLTPPWPELLIAGGRASMAPAMAIQKQNPACFTIILQNPYLHPRHFGCVIAPYHDHLEGPNVIPVLGTLHRLNQNQIKKAAENYPCPSLAPITTVLLGGDSRHYRYQKSDMMALASSLKAIGGHALITPSRRTNPHLLLTLKNALQGHSYDIWDGTGENPYTAYLGLADQIIVTQDSISIPSEACYTGKPVYVWEVAHRCARFRDFYHDLYTQGYAKPFQWPFPQWSPKKLDEMARVIPLIQEKMHSANFRLG